MNRIKVFCGENHGGVWSIPCKPIISAAFNWRLFVLAADARLNQYGFPVIDYWVFDAISGYPICASADKGTCLSQARSFLKQVDRIKATAIFARYAAETQARIEQSEREAREAIERARLADKQRELRPISKRRRTVFEASGGKCNYCSVSLDIRSNWHVEHKVPRSRGGNDLPENLVASCGPCNRRKSRMTDKEFASVQALIEQSTEGKIKAVK